jgi:hypothetical protein
MKSKQSPVKSVLLLVLAVGLAAAAAAQAPKYASLDPTALGLKSRFTIEIRNPNSFILENLPIIFNVREIWDVVPDFQSYVHGMFEELKGEFALVRSQADDLNGDRYHEEIVILKTLPPNSTTRLACYYAPKGQISFQFPARAFSRLGRSDAPDALGWESNMATFELVAGRIAAYGKLKDELILRNLPAPPGMRMPWGMPIFPDGEGAGLGTISLWEGETRVPLFGAGAPGGLTHKREAVVRGPLRAAVRVTCSGLKLGGAEAKVTMLFSAFAANLFSRQEVLVEGQGLPQVASGPGLQKLAGETAVLDAKKGVLWNWGQGRPGAGEIGLAAIFPPQEFVGSAEIATDRFVKLKTTAGEKVVCWIYGGWQEGVMAPLQPYAQNWEIKVNEMARKVLAPIQITYKKS